MHIGIIMDGNGRWAKQRGRPRTFGHKVGADRVDEIVRACPDLGVKYLSLYAFSTENWNRPKKEVSFLLNLFAKKIKNKTGEMKKEGVRILFLGDRTAFPKNLLDLMTHCESETATGRKVTLALCLNYGGRDEILRAVRKISEKVREGMLQPFQIDEKLFNEYLDTRNLPPPDLIIRTSGELRLSNFLLFQSAYAELYFTETLWPDFSVQEFALAIADFKKRKRRFGNI